MIMIVTSYTSDIVNGTVEALQKSDIDKYLRKEYAVSIKPNLIDAYPASDGATTHPEVVEGIILFLQAFGVRKIKIIEGAWAGGNTKRAFKTCGYEALSKKFGIPLIDLKSDSYTIKKYGGYGIEVCNEVLTADFLINVPVLKGHSQTLLTCCMKNLKGCITDNEKRRFHTLGLHKPIAALNMVIKTGYCIVDGICGDLSFEEGGNPVQANRIIAGRDPVMVDSYCAELIGYRPDEIKHLKYGREFGAGEYYSADTKIIELNKQNKPQYVQKSKLKINKFKSLIKEDAACSACYSSLVFALDKLGGRPRAGGTIHIGQGFKGKSGEGIGIGNCTQGFSECIPGCPPKALDIVEALE